MSQCPLAGCFQLQSWGGGGGREEGWGGGGGEKKTFSSRSVRGFIGGFVVVWLWERLMFVLVPLEVGEGGWAGGGDDGGVVGWGHVLLMLRCPWWYLHR